MDEMLPKPVESLLARREWVRRIARSLVRGEVDADDLEQDAWLRVLRRGATITVSPLRWIRSVLRNVARDAARARERRERHEGRAAPGRGPARPDRIAEEAETHRLVVDAVLDLSEPYRSTVLLRYFEGLSLAETAARLGVPRETVRTRLKRAMPRLRERLQGRHDGDRRALWLSLAALAGLTGSAEAAEAGTSSLAAGAILMSGKLKAVLVAASVLLVLVGGYAALRPPRGEVPPESPGVVTNSAPPRAAVPANASIIGRLLAGSPPAPAEGTVVVGDRTARSDAEGRFRLELAASPRAATLVARVTGYPDGRLGGLRVAAGGVLDVGDIVLAHASGVRFLVVDTSGRGVPRALVELRRPLISGGSSNWVWTQFGAMALRPVRSWAVTGRDGRAIVTGMPPDSWRARVSAEGFATTVLNVNVTGFPVDPVTVVLDRAHSLVGTVTGGEGRPLSGIPVLAYAWDSTPRAPITRARTDPSGAYQLTGLPSGRIALRVRPTPDLAYHAGTIEVPGVPRYDIEIRGDAVHEGIVRDAATRNPVAGALVGLSVQGSWSSTSHQARAVTGRNGTFRIAGLPAGRTNVNVSADGYLAFPRGGSQEGSTCIRRLAPGVVATVEILLTPSATVRGRVTGPEGRPVAGAEVGVYSSPEGLVSIRSEPAYSQSDGSYEITTASPGAGLISVRKPGLVLPGGRSNCWGRLTRPGGRANLPASIAIRVASEGVTVRDVTLRYSGAVEGRAVFADGSPAKGCEILLSEDGGIALRPALGLTGEDGSFRFASPSDSPAQRVCAVGPGGAVGWSSTFAVGPGETVRGIDVVVERGCSLFGVLRSGAGAPLSAPDLRLLSGSDTLSSSYWIQVAVNRGRRVPLTSDGRFRLTDLRPGNYVLYGRAGGHGEGLTRIEVQGGTETGPVEIALPGELAVRGRAIDEGGAPVLGAHAIVGKSGARSSGYWWPRIVANAVADDEGRFVRRGLSEGIYRVRVLAPGRTYDERLVRAGGDEVPFTLPTALAIEGRVVDVDSGRPLGGISVGTGVPRPLAGSLIVRTLTDAEGRFRIDDLPAGTYDLTARIPFESKDALRGYGIARVAGVAAGRSDVEIGLRRGPCIEGRVLDPDGRPVLRAVINAYRSGGNASGGGRHTSTDAEGRFRLDGLVDGSWTVEARATSFWEKGLLPTSVPEVRPGGGELKIVLHRGYPITGRVVHPDGVPFPSEARIHYRARGQAGAPGTGFQPDGAFSTPPLDPEKRYDLFVTGVPGALGGRALSIAPGATGVRVALQKTERSITGRVLDSEGCPAGPGVPVEAIAVGIHDYEPGARSRTRTGADGTFRLESLGEHPFRVRAGGRESGYERCEHPDPVPAGTRGLEIRVRRIYRFSGTVCDRGGSPLRVEEFVLEYEDPGTGRLHRSTQTGGRSREGRFDFRSIPVKQVRLRVRVSGEIHDAGTFDLPLAGAEVRLE